MSERLLLNDLAPERLARELEQRCGATAAEARKICSAVHGPRGVLADGSGVEALGEIRAVRRKILDRVIASSEVRRLAVVGHTTSTVDGFRRYLFETADHQRIEAVRIPLPCDVYGTVPPNRLVTRPHYVVCVSSQAGCALGCTFCATGKLGFQRNLATWEIVEQLRLVRAEADRPVRGVVFMGMGEPFLNYDRVIAAAQILSNPSAFAIAADRITISTVGIVPAIRRYTRERQPYRLAVSLTAATSAKRRRVLPVEDTWPLADLMAAVREHQAANGERATLAWVAIDGFNTGPDDAAELAELTRGLPIRLDLIEVADPDGEYHPPSEAKLSEFRTHLAVLGQPVVRRYSGGRDIRAGCGMLAATALAPQSPASPTAVEPGQKPPLAS